MTASALRRSLRRSTQRWPLSRSGDITRLALTAMVVLLLGAACAGPPPVPVEERTSGSENYSLTPDGHYRIRREDSLYAIAFRFGLDWRDLASWNAIAAPYVIHPNELLRLSPPGTQLSPAGATDAGGVSVQGISSAGSATTRDIEPSTGASAAGAPPEPADVVAPSGEMAAANSTASHPAAPTAAAGTRAPAGADHRIPTGDPRRWLWPTKGPLHSRFAAGDSARKGIDIGGAVGQPIIASADGQVVYSGSGLIGYGELIIIKHSDRMLSAYAHNSRRLVSEGEDVQAGQQISEMGTNDRNQPILHFEIRVNGVPQNPLAYLPEP